MTARWLLLLSLFAIPVHGEERRARRVAESIEELIQQLGDTRYVARQRAARLLTQAGEKALPQLRRALRETDPEIRLAARSLLLRGLSASGRGKQSKLECMLIDSGEFTMGSPINERQRKADERQHRVSISRPFYIGMYEVTQLEFETVMGHNPSWFKKGGEGNDKISKFLSSKQLPVELVTWFDAAAFCNGLSQQDGFAPYYKLMAVKRSGKSIVAAQVEVLGGNGYRLPTEAEWEYACRAGTTTPYHFGRTNRGYSANVKQRISTSYGGTSTKPGLGRTQLVGRYEPNRWGVHDMHGNVAEWCEDWYDQRYYDHSPTQDPRGPRGGRHRVVRGGSWILNNDNCRSASRFWQSPDERKYYAGFRVARNPSRYVLEAIRK